MASASELQRRHAALRAAMRAAGYAAVVVAGNTEFQQKGYIRYLADWRLFGGAGHLVFAGDQEPVFFLGLGAQAEWARQLSAVSDTRAVPDKIAAVAAALIDAGCARARIGVVGLDAIMPHGDATRLIASLPEARIEDATDLIESFWGILSTEQLAEVEASHGQVAQVFDAFRTGLRPGRSERDVVADAYRVAVSLGCLEGMIHLSPDAGSGTRPASERVIRADDTIKMFMEFLTPAGYFIELGGCFSFRKPPEAQQRKFDLVARAIAEAMAASRPGMRAGEIVALIRRRYETEGWTITGRRLWDFHGQGMHSLLRPFGLPDSTDEFRANMMINIHPGLLTADGFGVSATSNYVVTPDGGRALGGFRHEWYVL